MEALKAEGVVHSYGKGESARAVLDGFSLSVAKGGFTALMGPSGSGKSTFLHLAAGLLSPRAGSIVVDGEDVTRMGDAAAARFRRRRVGVVFQAFNLVETLTVADNILLPARLDRARVSRERLGELVGKLSLNGLEHRRPRELSGGERQRVALARALYARPALVLADEPTGNLDVKAARATCGLLRELNASEGCAVLLVTHDPVVAATADRVSFLRDGRIVASCPTSRDPAVVSREYLVHCGR